jgi:hypothetical protein
LEQFAEAVARDHERLRKEVEAWKGIHEGAVLAMQSEITRLKEKCDKQAMIIGRWFLRTIRTRCLFPGILACVGS